jgi:hypothetical protein
MSFVNSSYKPDPSVKDALKNVKPDGSVVVNELLEVLSDRSTHIEILNRDINIFRTTGQMTDYLKKNIKTTLFLFSGAPVVSGQEVLQVDYKKMKLKVMLPFVKPLYGISDSISATKIYLARVFGPNWEIECDIIPKNDDPRPTSARRRKKVKPQRAKRTKKNRKRP